MLKPYTKERFTKAINKLQINSENNKIAPLAERLMIDKRTYLERILVNHNKKLITISVEEIILVEAYGDYSKLYTSIGNFLSNYDISTSVEKLNLQLFIRINRS